MTAHDEVGAGFSPTLKRGSMPAQSVGLVLGTRDGDGLVHHDDAQLRRDSVLHQSGHTVDLQRGDLTVFVSPGSRGVDADHQKFRRVVHRFEICAERGAVPPIRAAQARPQIEERDVVVAWNGQHCGPQVVYKRACRAELRRASALRDVARQHSHIRTLLVGQCAQGFDDRALLGAEVRVGNLQQHTHQASSALPLRRGTGRL